MPNAQLTTEKATTEELLNIMFEHFDIESEAAIFCDVLTRRLKHKVNSKTVEKIVQTLIDIIAQAQEADLDLIEENSSYKIARGKYLGAKEIILAILAN